jgi:hypothetical protein
MGQAQLLWCGHKAVALPVLILQTYNTGQEKSTGMSPGATLQGPNDMGQVAAGVQQLGPCSALCCNRDSITCKVAVAAQRRHRACLLVCWMHTHDQ